MDYNKHYNLLIERAKHRNLTGYKEMHHIVPRCMGGDDSDDNLIFLTAEEHYIAHALLVKIHKNTPYISKLICAFRFMSVDSHNGNRIHNKDFGWMRRLYAKHHPCKELEVKEKISNSLNMYYASTSEEDRYRVARIERECRCGCGQSFIVKETSSKLFIQGHHQKIFYNDPSKRKEQSERCSALLSNLTPEEMHERLQKSLWSCDQDKRAKSISDGKKGKKTNQSEIESRRYGLMSDAEFETYIEGRTASVATRMKNRRKKYLDEHNN